MEAVGVVSVGGGGRGFGSGGIGHDSGERGKPDTANTMFRLSGGDFKQLGKGFGRVRDTLKEFGATLEYMMGHEGLAISLQDIMSEESRNALEALGYMLEYTPPPSEGASYQDFCVRNSACVTHGSFDIGGKDKTIGNAWRAAYERGLFQKFGIRDSCTPSSSSSSVSSVSYNSNDGSTGGHTSGGGNSGGSLTTNAYSCETVPSGNAAVESRISDSDGASSDSDSRFRITIAAPSSGDGGRAAFSPDDVSSDGDISGGGGSSGAQATMKDTAESTPSQEPQKVAEFGARVEVLFDDGKRYWGTINNHATSPQDSRHPDGPWSVLFDDCTQERFREGDKDFTVTDKPRLRRMTMAQQEFYLEHPNGIELLKHVKNLSVGPDAVARREKEHYERMNNNRGARSMPPAAAIKPKPRRASAAAGARSTTRKHSRSPAPKRACY